MSSDIYDSWIDDGQTVDPGTLHMRLIELRDNFEPDLPAKGEARQRRIARMQTELAEISRFVEDCDRYAEQTRDVTLQGPDVRLMMNRELARIRSRAVERGRQVNSELHFVKAQTP